MYVYGYVHMCICYTHVYTFSYWGMQLMKSMLTSISSMNFSLYIRLFLEKPCSLLFLAEMKSFRLYVVSTYFMSLK